MDWDRVGAEDIFLLLASFCPPAGSVSSVKIYLSGAKQICVKLNPCHVTAKNIYIFIDFGKERLEEEKELGPKELRRLQGEDVGDNSEEDEDIDPIETNRKSAQREAAAMERVRQYQVNRLKYYYAVAVLDSVETAARWDTILALQKVLC